MSYGSLTEASALNSPEFAGVVVNERVWFKMKLCRMFMSFCRLCDATPGCFQLHWMTTHLIDFQALRKNKGRHITSAQDVKKAELGGDGRDAPYPQAVVASTTAPPTHTHTHTEGTSTCLVNSGCLLKVVKSSPPLHNGMLLLIPWPLTLFDLIISYW